MRERVSACGAGVSVGPADVRTLQRGISLDGAIAARHHDRASEVTETVVLWRPTGPEEPALVEASVLAGMAAASAGAADLLPGPYCAVRH
jgi:hypothetical protein